MAAQIGSSVLLSYGEQGAQQLGNAVLLDAVVVATSTRLVASTRAGWGSAARREVPLRAAFERTSLGDSRVHAGWASGRGLDEHDSAAWGLAQAKDRAARAPWSFFTGRAAPRSSVQWAISAARDDAARAPWGTYERHLQPDNRTIWTPSAATDQRSAAPWGGPMLIVEVLRDARFAPGVARDLTQWVPWVQFSRTLSAGVGISIPPDDGVPTALVVVPIRSVYMQVNAVSLRKVVGNVALPAFNMSMSLDRNSWVWSFSASLPADAQQYIEPTVDGPVELEASVNGQNFRLLVERITRERQFARASISISGRGKMALLDAPYAPLKTFANDEDATIEQLLNQVLTDNGVSLGYTVNFEPDNWLVPAGAFSHRGSYISALNDIAAAAGAYIQPHETLDELFVRKLYPSAPWDWATLVDPDIELPSAPVSREGIEWVERPAYNRVYVSGTQMGVLGRVTRAGTAGDLLAPMVTHPLITHADAARQRGLPELAAVGRMANVTLRLPVLDETGVIVPGKFVRYVDGATTRIGLTRAVSLDIASPQVWQTIQLETHV